MFRRKTFLILLLPCLAFSLVGFVSWFRTLAIEHTWSDGTWWQVGAVQGSLRFVRIAPIGPPTDAQTWMKNKYQEYWRGSRESRWLGWRPLTAWSEGKYQIFHEAALYVSLFIPLGAIIIAGAVVVLWRRFGNLAYAIAREIPRPKNHRDASRRFRRILRKAFLTIISLTALYLTIATVWENYRRDEEGTLPSNYYYYSTGPWTGLPANWPRVVLLENTRFDLTITELEHALVIDVFAHFPCGVPVTRFEYSFAEFSLQKNEINLTSGFPACGHYSINFDETGNLEVLSSPKSHLLNSRPIIYTLIIPWWLIVAVLMIPLVYAFLRGLVRRAQRRFANRCIVCGYSLKLLTEPRCPECGEPASTIPLAHPPVSS